MRSHLIYIYVLLIIISNGCIKDNSDLISEIPKQIIRTKIDPSLYPQIAERFPEWVNANTKYPHLFTDTIQKRIIVTESSEVFLAFITEKAGFRNTIGWYSYQLGSPPQKAEDINIHLLFPNASLKGEGGELLEGDMVQLGNEKFPKGTVIGFFLISNGWNEGSINYKNPTYYSDQFLNPKSYQYHVLFKEKGSKNIILAFEDMDYEMSDKDYNDLLFIVSDNKEGFESIFFDLNKLPLL